MSIAIDSQAVVGRREHALLNAPIHRGNRRVRRALSLSSCRPTKGGVPNRPSHPLVNPGAVQKSVAATDLHHSELSSRRTTGSMAMPARCNELNLTDRGLLVVMIGFMSAIVLGVGVVIWQYLLLTSQFA